MVDNFLYECNKKALETYFGLIPSKQRENQQDITNLKTSNKQCNQPRSSDLTH